MLIFDVGNSAAANLQITNLSVNEGLIEAQIDSTGATFDLDSDGDGHSDWQEIRAGTDPLRAASHFGIASLSLGAGGARVIRILSVPGKTYQLQFKRFLADPAWVDVGPATTASDSITAITDSVPGQTSGVYRVQLVE